MEVLHSSLSCFLHAASEATETIPACQHPAGTSSYLLSPGAWGPGRVQSSLKARFPLQLLCKAKKAIPLPRASGQKRKQASTHWGIQTREPSRHSQQRNPPQPGTRPRRARPRGQGCGPGTLVRARPRAAAAVAKRAPRSVSGCL